MATKGTRRDVDWEAVEQDYRAGVLSVRLVAKKHGISHTAIQKRAAKEGWERTLSKPIRQSAEAKVAKSVASEVATDNARETVSDRDVIEANAEMLAQVIKGHRNDIKEGRDLVRRLVSELSNSTSLIGEIEKLIVEETQGDQFPGRRQAMLRAVSLGSRASTMRDLSQALKNVVTLERQAFGLDDEKDKDKPADYVPVEERVKMYEREDAEQLGANVVPIRRS